MSGYESSQLADTVEGAINARSSHFRTNYYERNRIRLHRRRIFTEKQGRLLDIGSHSGEFIKHFAHLATEIVALDYQHLLAKAAQRNLEVATRTTSVCASAATLPFRDNSFDTVVMVELIEHLPWELHRSCLSEAWRVLRPGGTLILSTPNETSITARDGRRNAQRYGSKWQAWDVTHVALYHADQMNRLIQDFQPKHVKRYAYFYLKEKMCDQASTFEERIQHALSYWISLHLSSWWPVFRLGFNSIFKVKKA